MSDPNLPTATDWEQAVNRIYETYPSDIFPPDSDSPDAKAGTWARKVCLNIITEAWRIRTDRAEKANHERWYGPGHIDGSGSASDD